MSIRHFAVACCLVAVSMLTVPPHARAACNPGQLAKTSYGSRGVAVTALQTCLIEAGYSIPAGATGYYGAQTKSAVQAFYAHALNQPTWDGLSVGPQGRATLGSLARGSSGSGMSSTAYKRVGSAGELARYIKERDAVANYGFGVQIPVSTVVQERASATDGATGAPAPLPTRVSETTVQVAGIDEPDVVKTDGEHIYLSKRGWYGGGIIRPLPADPVLTATSETVSEMPIWQDDSKTRIIDAFPATDLSVLSDSIPEKGELLFVKDKRLLIVLAHPTIVAYDVSNPKKPLKKWSFALSDNTSLITSRLTDGTLYLATQTLLDSSTPCPYIPITRGSNAVAIPCKDIWITTRIEPVLHTLTVLAIDPVTGTAKRTLALAESGDTTTISLFKDNVYIATKSYVPQYEVMTDITITLYAPYVSAETLKKMRTIAGYDLSAAGKFNEINLAAQSELSRKSDNERMRIETEFGNAFKRELGLRKRELDRTRITRVPLSTLAIGAVTEIPGTLLNQFSLDEYKGDVRVAVTVGTSWWDGETANDVYVLGSDLKEKGRIQDLGLGERVYSARFVGDTGYLVTFRQIDPFYVLDLSVPTAPKLAGELKIPGYSAYLEPLGNDLILGVGREGNGVKLSVFDVSNPAKPIERSKYLIKDAWSEVENNHHAFLRDAKHEVFFIPGGNGGYVFSYRNGTLSLKATVAGWSINRAVYIDDNLYMIGDDKITVLDETTWKQVKELAL